MNRIGTALLVSLVGLVTATASAQAARRHAAPDFAWAGPYVGLNGGGEAGTLNWSYDGNGPSGVVNRSTSGGFAGITGGFNWQRGRLVFGIEGDIDWANIHSSKPCPNPLFNCNSSTDWIGTLRGRLGWAHNAWLLYGTAGVAAGDVNIQTVSLPGTPQPTSGTPVNGTRTTDVGWTAGIGADYGFSQKWSASFELLYYDLGNSHHTVDNSLAVTTREAGTLFRIGINRRF